MATLQRTFQPQILIYSSQLSVNIKESLLYLFTLLLESETFFHMQAKIFQAIFCISFPAGILIIPSNLVPNVKVLATYNYLFFPCSSFLSMLQTLGIRRNLKLYLAFKDQILQNLWPARVLFDRNTKVSFRIASVINSTTQSTWDLASEVISCATDMASEREYV